MSKESRIIQHLAPIEQVARDMAKYAQVARRCLTPDEKKGTIESDVAHSSIVSMFCQLEVLKLRCQSLRSDKAYKELANA